MTPRWTYAQQQAAGDAAALEQVRRSGFPDAVISSPGRILASPVVSPEPARDVSLLFAPGSTVGPSDPPVANLAPVPRLIDTLPIDSRPLPEPTYAEKKNDSAGEVPMEGKNGRGYDGQSREPWDNVGRRKTKGRAKGKGKAKGKAKGKGRK